MLRVAYIAGPFRAANAWEIEQNIRRAEEVALEVWRLPGWCAICPHTNSRFFQGAAPDDVWLKGDLEILKRCDALVLAPHWVRSSGTRAEIRRAIECKIRVYGDAHHLEQGLPFNPVWLGLEMEEFETAQNPS